jgi:cellulose synthase/poly-beta-1,6-N-acetylglucosamine synthase-like glycosyltransferase
MTPLLMTLKIVYGMLSCVTLSVLLYQVVLALLSGKRKRCAVTACDRFNRFAIVVSARNEAAVIGHLIDSLMRQQYPREYFDVYVIADNCTDNTAQVAREHGALVYERTDAVKKGKGYALNWMFDIIRQEKPAGYYDAYGIFDADNLVSKDYLMAMNHRLLKGADIVQGYRDIKNPSDTWVSGSYAIYFWCISTFFMRPRERLGMSGLVSGTGFVFRAPLIAQHGWNTQTITEDCEFSLMQILDGHRVCFEESAVFYDEQPLTFRQAVRQRYRWAVGSIQCIKLFFADLFKTTFKRRSMVALDMVIYLMSIPCSAIIAVNTFLGAAIRYMGQSHWYQILTVELVSLAVTVVVMFLHGILTVKMEGKSLRANVKGIFGWPLFLLSWMYISLFSIFYRNTTWKPIHHTSTLGLDSMKDEEGSGVSGSLSS